MEARTLTLFYEMLTSLRCRLAGILLLLVTLLGIVVFALFSKYMWFGEISATLLMPTSFFLYLPANIE